MDLHARNMAYGDLSPGFISMDEHGYLCLSDFISDKLIQRKNKKNPLKGNILYLAPEKIFQKLQYKNYTATKGKEGDWYSLGVIM